jgi:hypothetical protein
MQTFNCTWEHASLWTKRIFQKEHAGRRNRQGRGGQTEAAAFETKLLIRRRLRGIVFLVLLLDFLRKVHGRARVVLRLTGARRSRQIA